jgi:hypothetical protein
MKKNTIKKVTLYLALFIVAALIIIASGFYKKSLTSESITINFGLKGDKVKPITYDIANQGIPKRIAQPGKVTVSTGHGAGIVNDTEEPVTIQVKANGFPYDVELTSTEVSFDKESGKFSKPIEVGKGVNLNITLEIPHSFINKREISNGNIDFINVKSGEVITTVPINVVNTNV